MRFSLTAGVMVTSFALFVSAPVPVQAGELCSDAPRTGCKQAGKVKAFAKEGKALRWTWRKGDEVDLGTVGDIFGSNDFALCFYDGDATGQDEIDAPLPGTDSLVAEYEIPAGADWEAKGSNKFLYKQDTTGSDGIFKALIKLGEDGKSKIVVRGKGPDLDVSALAGINREVAISQLQSTEGECFGAQVGIEYDNGPQYFGAPKLLAEKKARSQLDALAADFNRRQAGAPLNMTLWISGVAANQMIDLALSEDPKKLDTKSLFSALHVAGWFGGMWFQRDGFVFAAGGEPCTPSLLEFGCTSCAGDPGCPPEGGLRNLPNPGQADAAVAAYAQGLEAQKLSDSELLGSWLTAEDDPNGSGFDSETGLRSLVSFFGYNTGYSFAVLEDQAGVFMPDPNTLVCAGDHPPLDPIGFPGLPPTGPPADGELFSCAYEPAFLQVLPSLRPFKDDYIAAFPVKTAELTTFQNNEEARGRGVWFFLAFLILQDPDVRKALWDVDNAFLETLNGAGLATMGALAHSDADLGRQAALAAAMVKGWLASYQYGLPAEEPRTLPKWDLGKTPIKP